jgi:hypothetical protein
VPGNRGQLVRGSRDARQSVGGCLTGSCDQRETTVWMVSANEFETNHGELGSVFGVLSMGSSMMIL